MPSINRGSAILVFSIALVLLSTFLEAYTIPRVSRTPFVTHRSAEAAISMSMSNEEIPEPTNFREAEVLGLRLMQEGRFDEALVGMYRVCHIYCIALAISIWLEQ